MILRRRRAKAGAERGASAEDFDATDAADGAAIGMQEQNTAYERVATHELTAPHVIHEHDRNRDSNGTMAPLIRYGDEPDARYSRNSEDIANGRYSRHSEDIGDERY